MTIARGERHGSAKLTWRKVGALRERWRARRESYRTLARRFGISRQQVLRILHGQHWTAR